MDPVDILSKSRMSTGFGRFTDKVVVVTGGCKGIGAGCVEVFREAEGKAAVWDVDDEVGKTIASEDVLYIRCDMTDEDEIKNAVEKTVERFGRIDCLINNAGSHPPFHKIDEYPAEDLRKLMDLNFVAYYLAAQHCLPHIRKTNGTVVNIASQVGSQGQKFATAYSATKGAVIAFSMSLAKEEAAYGVRVNAVSPTATVTPMLRGFYEEEPSELEEEAARAPLGRFCRPEEIGKLCLFLATEGTFITGEDLHPYGGIQENW
ncbi:17-beta-hydroxysteroid dehydrogenase 14-like [Mya arenaria]|uniref:17-beta-hydroxysteroid dehydrogenase 14-like n=1 Tax=Mya arenaria TaxID=6604 RepID=UPI0022E8CEE3|nr:17-beta-hydroxysteroid dehydrogenase 14-like [Mya arenaria]